MAALHRFLDCSILLMCVCAFTEVVAVEMTYQLRKSFIEKINNYRANVTPPAYSMKKLEWSESLEQSAHQKAIQCNIDLPAPSDKGETKYTIYDLQTDPATAADAWNDQGDDYDITYDTCLTACDDYKQMVYDESKAVGCSIAECSGAVYVYCHYDEKVDGKPYDIKSDGFYCPAGTVDGEDKLCYYVIECAMGECPTGTEMDRDCICYTPESTTVRADIDTTVVTDDAESKTDPARTVLLAPLLAVAFVALAFFA